VLQAACIVAISWPWQAPVRWLWESTHPNVAGIVDAVLGYVDMIHQIAAVK
jgi:hypothetical protein